MIIAWGQRIYNKRCYFCHGYSGDAKTQASVFLSPKPRAFTEISPDELTREQMINAVIQGRDGTAMQSFQPVLTVAEINAVIDFIWHNFITQRHQNTRYHTVENGWLDHERYQAAFPYVEGNISLAQADTTLTPRLRQGKQLFLSSCISCHEPENSDRAVWRDEPFQSK